jgi:hypothetical protein
MPWQRSILVVTCLCACNASDRQPEPEAVLEQRAPIKRESDEEPTYRLSVDGRPMRDDVRAVSTAPGAVYATTKNAELVRIDAEGQHVLLDGVRGKPAVLEEGAVVVARDFGDTGETDLWLVPARGALRALGAHPGPDDQPMAIPDGRIAFVSGRTGIVSVFVLDPKTDSLRQLTNRGLSVGKPLVNFVPPPLEVESVTETELVYDAGGGERWRVELETGEARKL